MVDNVHRPLEWVSYLPTPTQLPEVTLASDVSGSWGCGALQGRSWFQCQWDDTARPLAITVKELIPIILPSWVIQFVARLSVFM